MPEECHVNFARDPLRLYFHEPQLKGRHINFARDPLHSYFHEPQKNKIHLLYLHFVFYVVFDHYLWNFDLNLVNKRLRKVIIWRAWLLCSTVVIMTWCQSNVMSANQQLHMSMTSLMHKVAWTSVVHRCMNLVSPKWIHLRKLLVSVNIICSLYF